MRVVLELLGEGVREPREASVGLLSIKINAGIKRKYACIIHLGRISKHDWSMLA